MLMSLLLSYHRRLWMISDALELWINGGSEQLVAEVEKKTIIVGYDFFVIRVGK